MYHKSLFLPPAPPLTKLFYSRHYRGYLVRRAAHYMLTYFASALYLSGMNSKHRKTLAAVFTDPVSGIIEWVAVESLLLGTGARLIEGRGSRVRFEKDGEVATFHRPHPAKEAKRYQLRDARDFLERIGVRP